MNLRETLLQTAWVLIAAATVRASPVGDCPPVDPLDHTDHLPDSKNCSVFYKCDHAAPVLFECPDGLHFNPDLQVCDWPNRAGCAGEPVPTEAPSSPKPTTTTAASTAASTSATTATTNPPPAPSEDCPAIGTCPQYEDENSIAKHLPHATNCSQFCKCDHGKPVKFDCPAGLHFNPALEVCDWPNRAGCAGGSSTPQATSSPKPTTTTHPSTTASTSATTTTTNSPPATSEDCPAIGTCPQYEDENSIAKHLPHATNCSQFCKCDHGTPVKFDCPAGLHFNPALEVCDWPNRAGCAGGSSPTPDPTSPKPTTTFLPLLLLQLLQQVQQPTLHLDQVQLKLPVHLSQPLPLILLQLLQRLQQLQQPTHHLLHQKTVQLLAPAHNTRMKTLLLNTSHMPQTAASSVNATMGNR